MKKIPDLQCEVDTIGGIGGLSKNCIGEVENFMLGNIVKTGEAEIELSKDVKGALGEHTMYDGLIGMGIIKNYNLVIDQNGKKIYFKARSNSISH